MSVTIVQGTLSRRPVCGSAVSDDHQGCATVSKAVQRNKDLDKAKAGKDK